MNVNILVNFKASEKNVLGDETGLTGLFVTKHQQKKLHEIAPFKKHQVDSFTNSQQAVMRQT